MKKNYVVAVKSGEKWKNIHNLLLEINSTEPNIPSRSCSCVDMQDDNDNRSTYLLSEDEANLLRKHESVDYVELDVNFHREVMKLRIRGSANRFPDVSKVYKQAQNTNPDYDDGAVSSVSPPNSFKHLINPDNYSYPTNISSDENYRTGWQITRVQQNSYTFSYDEESAIEQRPTHARKSLDYGEVFPEKYAEWFQQKVIKKPSNILEQSVQYDNDGTDVDVVIVDDGVWFGHPEFVDSDGNRLVKDIIIDGPYNIDPDWFNISPSTRLRTYMGVTTPTDEAAFEWWTDTSKRSSQFSSIGTLTGLGSYNMIELCGDNTTYPDKFSSIATHGTASAGLAYGKSFGHAFGANKWTILWPYWSNSPLTDVNVWKALKIFHTYKKDSNGNNQSVRARPTVMSLGSQGFEIVSNDENYTWKWGDEGRSFNGFTIDPGWSQITLTQQLKTIPNFLRTSPLLLFYEKLFGTILGSFVPELSTSEQTLKSTVSELSALDGAFIFILGGNQRQKIVKRNHPDYDGNYIEKYDYYTSSIKKFYLNRGDYHDIVPPNFTESPIFCVGALDENLMKDDFDDVFKERIAFYSVRGNRVDFYAPADDTLTASGYPNFDCLSGPYFFPRYDGNPNGLVGSTKAYPSLGVNAFDSRFNGTSAASPVAAGWFATFLQNRLHWTSKKLKKYIQNSITQRTSSDFYIGSESTRGNDLNQFDMHTLEGGESKVLYNAPVPSVTINTHPQSQSKNQGTSVTFSVSAEQTEITGPLSYQWQKALSSSPSSFIDISGKTSSTYTFTTSASDNQNLYRCKIVGEYGVDDTFSNSATLTVNRNPIDISLSSNSFNENISGNTTVAVISTTDLDAGDTFTYSLVSGFGDNSLFTISGDELKINSSPNYEVKNSYSVKIKSTDSTSLTLEKSFTLNVINLNETPTDISLSSNSFNENISANSIVAVISTTDPDTSDTFTYSLVSGTGSTDNSAFTISGDELKINSSPNYEVKNSYSIRIRATDNGGLYYEESFTLNVINLNETPTDISLSSNSFNENISANSIVAVISTTDPDAGNTFTYSLVSGTGSTDNSSFTISGSNLKINSSPNYEVKNSYSIRIRATDNGGLYYEKVFLLAVIDIDESAPNSSPTNILLSSNSFDENISANSVVAVISATDPDMGDTHTYGLVSGEDDTDNSYFEIENDELKINSSPNYEVKNSYSIRIRATDLGGLYFEKSFVLITNDINEAPTDISLSSNSFDENISANSVVAVISTTDPDAGNTFTYSLVSGTGSTDNSSFTISGNELKINSSPNYEVKNSYSIRIRATDSGSLTLDKVFVFSVNPVDEPPTNISLSSIFFKENISAGTVIAYLSSEDPEENNDHTFYLTSGVGDTDNSYFLIERNELIVNFSPDYETKSFYTIRVRVTDATNLSFEKSFNLYVVNLIEGFNTKISGNLIIENLNIF